MHRYKDKVVKYGALVPCGSWMNGSPSSRKISYPELESSQVALPVQSTCKPMFSRRCLKVQTVLDSGKLRIITLKKLTNTLIV
ncbi:hypothetical protein ACOME3_000622 [Neoechinorhynchus agilis]